MEEETAFWSARFKLNPHGTESLFGCRYSVSVSQNQALDLPFLRDSQTHDVITPLAKAYDMLHKKFNGKQEIPSYCKVTYSVTSHGGINGYIEDEVMVPARD